jgi:hypothetical protein
MVLQTAAALACWRPPAGLFAPVFDRGDVVVGEQAKPLVAAEPGGIAAAGEPAVAKVLTDRTEFWLGRFAAEIAAYRAFEVAAPPAPAPRLLAADRDAGVLVVTRMPGVPVSADRYPCRSPP